MTQPDCTIGEWTFTFTVSAAVPPSAGRTLTFSGVSVFETENGLCRGYREHFDRGAVLLALGIAPDVIRCVLAGDPGASAALLGERRRIAAEIALARHRLRRLDLLLAEHPPDDHRTEIVELPARVVAVLPFRLEVTELQTGVTRAIARLRSALRRGATGERGRGGATFPVDPAEQVGGFVFAPVAGWHGDLDTAWLPAGRAVTTVHRGSPANLPSAYHAAFAVFDELSAVAVGPVIEEYVTLDAPGTSTPSVHVYVPFARPA